MSGTALKLLWCLKRFPLFLNVAIILINNAEWRSYNGKSHYATLLPPISAYWHLGSSTGPSTVASHAWDCGFNSRVGTFHFSPFFLVVPLSHAHTQVNKHIHTHACTHKHAHTHAHTDTTTSTTTTTTTTTNLTRKKVPTLELNPQSPACEKNFVL